MNEDQGTLKERNETKRLENESARLKRGFFARHFVASIHLDHSLGHLLFLAQAFCIKGTIFDTAKPPADRDVYYDAQRDYNDGNLEAAANQIAKVLVKAPSHGPANQLMARIELARGNRKSALNYPRRSLDGSLNREEVAKWIAGLEAAVKE